MGSVLSVGCLCLLQAVGGAHTRDVPPELRDAEVRAVAVDARGDLWVGVRDRGLARVRDGRAEWIRSERLPAGVADIVDLAGEVWVSGLGGVGRGSPSAWTALELPGRPRVVFGTADGVWFGTSAGAARRSEGRWTLYDESDGLPNAVVHQVLVDGDGAVWFLCRTGLARLSDGAIDVYRPEVNFRNGVIGPDGRPWFGTTAGLLRWTGMDFVSELEGVTPYPRLVATDGSVWAGSASHGVFRHDGTEWTKPVAELDGHEVFDVAEGPAGDIWIASAVGLRHLPRAR